MSFNLGKKKIQSIEKFFYYLFYLANKKRLKTI